MYELSTEKPCMQQIVLKGGEWKIYQLIVQKAPHLGLRIYQTPTVLIRVGPDLVFLAGIYGMACQICRIILLFPFGYRISGQDNPAVPTLLWMSIDAPQEPDFDEQRESRQMPVNSDTTERSGMEAVIPYMAALPPSVADGSYLQQSSIFT